MGMCRVVLFDGSLMQLPGPVVEVKDGHLHLLGKDGASWIASFAPGSWRYWIWVEMAA